MSNTPTLVTPTLGIIIAQSPVRYVLPPCFELVLSIVLHSLSDWMQRTTGAWVSSFSLHHLLFQIIFHHIDCRAVERPVTTHFGKIIIYIYMQPVITLISIRIITVRVNASVGKQKYNLSAKHSERRVIPLTMM